MLSPSAIALVALSGSPPLADDRPRPEAFLGSLEAAQELARELNTPFVVIVVQEGEEANERFRDGLLLTDEFTDAMSGALVLLVNDGAHEMVSKRVVVDSERREIQVCGVFHTPSCEVTFCAMAPLRSSSTCSCCNGSSGPSGSSCTADERRRAPRRLAVVALME